MLYSKLWNEMYDKTKPTSIINWTEPTNELKEALKTLESVRFVSPSILTQIQTFSKFELQIGNVTIFNDTDSFSLIEKINFIYNFMYNIAKKPTENVQVYLFPLNIPKKITKGTLLPSVQNINSGVCIGHRTIIIWRLEEITKVLVHELVHAHRLDLYEEGSKLNKLLDGFNIASNSETAPNESITDTITFIIISYLNSRWSKNRRFSPEYVFKKEVMWTLNQMIKIYPHLDKPIYQETDVISYYFLKGMFLHSILHTPEYAMLFLGKTVFSNETNSFDKINLILRNKKNIKLLHMRMKKIKPETSDSLKMSFYS